MAIRILIVDDETDIAAYLATVLKANGFKPTITDDAETALETVRKIHPDLISLDIMMPRASGIAVYKQLRRDPRTDRIPVIIVSGVEQNGKFDFRSYVSDESIPEPQCFMEKPIDVDEYVRVIRQLTSPDQSLRRRITK